MNIDFKIYDTRKLLGVMRSFPPPNNYWLNLCFGREVQFDTQFIEFEKLTTFRKLAPLVVPMASGQPLYKEASAVTRIQPAYIKAKDPVNQAEMISRQPGSLLESTPPSPGANYNARVANISAAHRDAIERRWEVMAARAILDGQILLEGENYPARLVQFGRDANQTITLGAGNRWGDAGVDIIAQIEGWREIARLKPFGGAFNRMTMGATAWAKFRQDDNVFKTLNTLTRGTTSDIKALEPGKADPVEFVGRLGDIELYVYRDFYQTDDGTAVPIMDPRDVVLTGGNIDGVRAFGAILDKKAQFAPVPIFPKMWDEDDPAVTFIMTQSAPLMVPVNPNNTLKARVVA